MRGVVDERIGMAAQVLAPATYPQNGGLATPPSPRSLSADSGHGRRRRKRSASRGRSGSPRSPVSSVSADAITELARNGHGQALATPESSVHTTSSLGPEEKSLSRMNPSAGATHAPASEHAPVSAQMYMQTAIGVLVLSAVIAAVIWRVKPERLYDDLGI
ncbi:hypothetical protein B0H15DRAFT_1026774 [Mycena belliarum]|uniref:Uncharacterized protein n=1 Tax=Mycena belliarum TaxID=1033014 RepID=A0AAD6TQF6_9AGAR|nr:hypothetical protein B0H15DRAFT_1026774 [Mycena belliae]